MKKHRKALSIFLVLALCFSFCVPAFATTTVTISNPYENIDWSTVNTYKAALHSHTNASDGDMTLAQSLERHAEAGFDIVSITDHGTVDRGWTSDNSTFIRTLLKIAKRSEGEIEFLGESGTFPNGESYSCCTAQSGDEYLRVDGKKEILRIPFGIENNAVSVNAHVNSWFVDYCNNSVTTYEDAVKGVDKLGGVSVINHPGEYTKARYEIRSDKAYSENNFTYRYYINKFSSLLEKYPTCLGIDINSKGDSRTRFDRILWDRLLERFSAKGDTVFAIASSDAHQLDKIDTGYTLLLMPHLDSKSAKAALENGEFFAASHCLGNYEELCEIASALRRFYGESDLCAAVEKTVSEMKERIEGIESGKYKATSSIGITYSTLDDDGRLAAKTEPRITKIGVDRENGTLSVEAENAAIVRLISNGKLIDTKRANEAVFDLNDYAGALGDYVRAEVFGEGGMIYTQAFLLNESSKNTNESAACKGFFDLGFFDFLFGELNRLFSALGRKAGK